MKFLSLRYYMQDRSILSPSQSHTKEIERRQRHMLALGNLVDLFLAPSRYIREVFIRGGFSAAKIEHLLNGIDLEPGSTSAQTVTASDKQVRFGFVGTLVPPKGPQVLLRVFNGIQNANLYIYGGSVPYDGHTDYQKTLTAQIGNSCIQFMGKVEHHQVAQVLQSIDVLIVPSIWQENSPAVIWEALAMGVPVIAANIGGISETIVDRGNGLLFCPGDDDDLKAKIHEVVSNAELLTKLRRGARDTKVKHISEHAEELQHIYRKLISARRIVATHSSSE